MNSTHADCWLTKISANWLKLGKKLTEEIWTDENQNLLKYFHVFVKENYFVYTIGRQASLFSS